MQQIGIKQICTHRTQENHVNAVSIYNNYRLSSIFMFLCVPTYNNRYARKRSLYHTRGHGVNITICNTLTNE